MTAHEPTNGGARAAVDDPRERGIGELVKDLASQTSTLVRQEIKLAQTEVTEKGKLAGKGAGDARRRRRRRPADARRADRAADRGARQLLALWLAVLIVTLLWGVVAAGLALAGRSALQAATPPAPQTVETLKEDIQWAKNPTGSAGR